MKTFAVFVVALTESGNWAATTRPNGGIGLAGGKLDDGETPQEAAIREAYEEGWVICPDSLILIHEQEVDGKPVEYYVSTKTAVMLKVWKEQDRLMPVAVDYYQLLNSGFGNENAMPKAKLKLEEL
jgi:8-oxo-dGTP pyrophosphatase MutT (NUDIX family)